MHQVAAGSLHAVALALVPHSHLPLEQISPKLQLMPHPPQFVVELVMSVSQSREPPFPTSLEGLQLRMLAGHATHFFVVLEQKPPLLKQLSFTAQPQAPLRHRPPSVDLVQSFPQVPQLN